MSLVCLLSLLEWASTLLHLAINLVLYEIHTSRIPIPCAVAPRGRERNVAGGFIPKLKKYVPPHDKNTRIQDVCFISP